MLLKLKVRYLLVFLLTIKISIAQSQVVFEPTYHTVYQFLSRLSQKGIIELEDVVLPLSKDYINEKLNEASKRVGDLNKLEQDELGFYLKEYTIWWRKDPKAGFEGTYVSILKSKIGDRLRFATYQDENFLFNLQPTLGYDYQSLNEQSINTNSFGMTCFGYLGKNIGYSLDYRNNKLYPVGDFDFRANTGDEQGRIGYVDKTNSFVYNNFNATITGKWSWGSFTFGKNPLTMGYGLGGKIILSEKAPTFPHIKLRIQPTKWLDFVYAHGWLNSNVVDSSAIYKTQDPVNPQLTLRNKYYVMHAVTFKFIKGLTTTFGESSIYNDNIKVPYLIPIAPFASINHYLGEATITNTVSNSQVFFQFSSRNHLPKSHIYFSFFVDEMSLKGLSIDPRRNHTAYQSGLSVADFPFINMTTTVEYTRIRPFVYVHFIPAQTYENNGFYLGHWLGQNSDQFLIDVNYRVKRGLQISSRLEYVNKGGEGTPLQQTLPGDYPFLWGNVTSRSLVEFKLLYEPIHDLFFKLSFKHTEVTSSLTNSNKIFDIFNCGINYGF